MSVRRAICAAALALAACAGSDDEPEVSPACLEATMHDDFTWIEANILQRGCGAFRSCHQGTATEAGKLNLEVGRAYDELVSQPSSLHADRLLVSPGKPDESYLLVALGAVPGPLPMKGRMPLNNPPLCEQKIDALRRWIEAGAKRD